MWLSFGREQTDFSLCQSSTTVTSFTIPLLNQLNHLHDPGSDVEQVHRLISVAKQELPLRGKQLRAASEPVMEQYDDTIRTKRENVLLLEASNQLTKDSDQLRKDNAALNESLNELRDKRQDLVDANDPMVGEFRTLLAWLNDENDNVLPRLECVGALGSINFQGESILALSADEFNDKYKPQTRVAKALKLSTMKEKEALFSQSNIDFYNSDQYTQYLKLVVQQPPQVAQLTNQEIIDNVITPCNLNSEHYGKSKDKVKIQFFIPQIARQIHLGTAHFLPLIELLHNNNSKPGARPTFFFNWFLKPDYDSDKIPKLTSKLKLFFSTPNIVGGDWIQFHGPGTRLLGSGTDGSICLGSLCDPNKKGEFTGLSTRTRGDDKWVKPSRISHYSVVIRWE